MSFRHGLQAIARVVRRRLQQQAQQHTHEHHAGRQRPDVATSNHAQRYHSSRPTGPDVRLNTQNLAIRAARVWRQTPSSWSRFTQANGSRFVQSSRPVLPLLLGFAGIGLANQDGEGFAARGGIDLETALQVVQTVFHDRGLKAGQDTSKEFPDNLASYAFSKTVLAKGTEGAVFAAKRRDTVLPSQGDEELADAQAGNIPVDLPIDGGHIGEQPKAEMKVCDEGECNLAIKMMFNYTGGSKTPSKPADIMAEFEAEQLPLVLAGGSFSGRSNKYRRSGNSLCSSHPNIVLMHQAFVDDVSVPSLSSAVSLFGMALPPRLNPLGAGADTTMYIVMKRYRTSLRDYLNKGSGLPDRTIMVIVAQLLEAVVYLGNQGVVHRDLKSNNILVDYEEGSDEAPHVVVADFGCALSLQGKNLQETVSIDDLKRQGNPALMAPEVKKANNCYSLRYRDFLKADAWAVGAIVYEVCGQRNPFYAEGIDSSEYEAGDLPQLQSEAVGLRVVSELLLEKNPGNRPSAQVAANILHLLLWQPSVSSFLRLSQGQSSKDSELTAWIIKVSLMQQLLSSNHTDTALTFTPDDPGLPQNVIESSLVETFLKRVNSDSLIDASQRLVTALRPLGALAEFRGVSSTCMGTPQLIGSVSDTVTLMA